MKFYARFSKNRKTVKSAKVSPNCPHNNYDKQRQSSIIETSENHAKEVQREMSKKQLETSSDKLLTTRLYSLTEVEGILGVSHRTLLRWITDGKLKAVKVGSRWKVSEDTLKAILGGTNG